MKLSLLLRWLLGGIIGCAGSLLFLPIALSVYPPILGPVIVGQQEMFYAFFGFLGLSDLIYAVSVFLYSALWSLIGALLMSGIKKQKRFGVFLLVLYIVIGGCTTMILTALLLPT